jgi:hypothetical protein
MERVLIAQVPASTATILEGVKLFSMIYILVQSTPLRPVVLERGVILDAGYKIKAY